VPLSEKSSSIFFKSVKPIRPFESISIILRFNKQKWRKMINQKAAWIYPMKYL
jgi:hypothetical protein